MRTCVLSALLLFSLSCAAQLQVNDVTSSRALNTIYQNTTGHPVLVAAYAALNACTFASCQTRLTVNLISDTSATPTTIAATNEATSGPFGGQSSPVYHVIPANSYYKITAARTFTISDPGAPFLVRWSEGMFTTLTGGTQSVVTNSRSFTTVFHNASSNLLWVAFEGTAVGTTNFTATADSAASPTTVVQQQACLDSLNCELIFPVLPNYFYKITQNASGTIASWTEVTTPAPLNMTQNVVTGSRSVGFGGSYSTFFASNNAVLASVSITMSGISANSTLSGFVDSATPATITQTAAAKFQSGLNMVLLAIPSQTGYYAASADVNGAALQEWVEWDIPTVFACAGLCGEPKRHTVN